MISPPAALAGLVAALAIAAGGFWAGTEWEQGRAAEAHADQLEATAARLSRALVDNDKLARERARRNQAAATAAAVALQEGYQDAQTSADPRCNRSAQSMRLLHAAIAAANSDPDPAGRLLQPLPTAARPGGE